MTDFFEEGFLCTEIEKASKLCYEENKEWFSVCKKVNQYYVQLIPKLKFQNNNRQAAFTDALFIRQVALFESVIILSLKGMTREAKILLRTLIENVFILVALTKSEENAELYYNNNYLTKLKSLKAQKEYNSETFHQKGADKTLEELDEKVKSLHIKHIGIREWADKADLTNYYLTAYNHLSWTVHSNVLDSATLLEGVSDEDVRKVEWHPELDDVGIILTTAIQCSCLGAHSVNRMFELGLEGEINSFQVENRTIADNKGLIP